MKHPAIVTVIQPGYAIWEQRMKAQRADGTITFIESHNKVIVDTGLPKDKSVILEFLKKKNLQPKDIDFVVCTHGDADHISNNNLFPSAKLIVGFDIFDGDIATFFTKKIKIDDNITVQGMTGHDDRSVGVLVRTAQGKVVIAGDLFEYQNDHLNAREWIAFSKNPKQQIKTRAQIWELADYIVPGHGDLFKVDKSANIFEIETRQLQQVLQDQGNVYGDTKQ